MKKRVTKFALLAVLSGAAGVFLAIATCEEGTGVPPPEGQLARGPGEVPGWADPVDPPPVLAVYFAASDEDAAAGNYATQFSALETRDILLVAFWEPRDGTHVEKIEYYTPQGALYLTDEIAFTSSARRGPAHLKLEGHMAPLPVKHIPLSTDGATRVIGRLPVSGTAIMSNLVTGTWTARVYYDGQGPIATVSFEVLQ